MNHASRPCPVIAETPGPAAHFFGFHDLCPWDTENRTLAILRVAPELRRVPDGTMTAEICLWDPAAARITAIGETRAWNWQQGARQQWLPGSDSRLVYNRLEGGALSSLIVHTRTGETTPLPFTVSAISPDGTTALSPHFARLARHWPAYGYGGSDGPGLDDRIPANDGLWSLDMTGGAPTLIVSIAAAAAIGDGKRDGSGGFHFITHPTYSPTGKRICFLHRYFTADGALYSRLIAGFPDGSSLKLLAEEKVSHFDWLDDDALLVWTRRPPAGLAAARRSGLLANPLLRPLINIARSLRPGLKQKLLDEAYFRVDVEAPARKTAMARGLLTRDGHPMFTADRRHMITDTYPDQERMQTLILYDMDTGLRTDIGRFWADPSVGDGDIKCDLHPRWDRDERQVCVDSTHGGVRQCLIIDLSSLMDGGHGP